MTAGELLDALETTLLRIQALTPLDKASWGSDELRQLAVERLWIIAGTIAGEQVFSTSCNPIRTPVSVVLCDIADNIVCDAPAGRIEGAAVYRAFMGPFVQMLIKAEVVAAFGDDETALVMYDTETVPVKSAPGAECVTVKDCKITNSRFLFDRAPFEAARRAAT